MAKKKKVQAEGASGREGDARGREEGAIPVPEECPVITFRADNEADMAFLHVALARTERDARGKEEREWRKDLRNRLRDWELWRLAHVVDV